MKRPASKTRVIYSEQPPKTVTWGLHPSPAGKVMLGIAPNRAVCRLAFMPDGKAKPGSVLKSWKQEWPKTDFVKGEKETATAAKMISGARAMPVLQMTGTKFQQKVWKGLLSIPAGETLSYGMLAKRIKNPKAARAVGAACGANPVPLLVPCHRVIAGNGGLGGFTSGLAMKKALLKAEGKSRRV